MLLYTVFQERATQVIYLGTASIARGAGRDPSEARDRDSVLRGSPRPSPSTRPAHFDFYLGLARLHLYYFPEETLQALVDVVRHFVMPAAAIVPNYGAFVKELYAADLFGPRRYGLDVARPALRGLGIEAIKLVEAGLRRTREVPAMDGTFLPAPALAGCDFTLLESVVRACLPGSVRTSAQ